MAFGNFETHGNMSPNTALIQQALKDLNTVLQDAPESGGGPNWTKARAQMLANTLDSQFDGLLAGDEG
ncbi:hypothetical protein [Streptomyces mobaraensis]|uniref:Uncharacterized protein n=1 Tax=Streptomyces mobaraensis TaxID=35621 RepID=A0A5N5VZG6_STRMB|nr:hypothetical protein [Streptomyces mobaraensis]KAB7834340.1 hypothetical protein FRZ00_30580 [Streptomyces mobaraensis]